MTYLEILLDSMPEKLADKKYWESFFTQGGTVPRQKGILLLWEEFKEADEPIPPVLQKEIDYILMGRAKRAEPASNKGLFKCLDDYDREKLKKDIPGFMDRALLDNREKFPNFSQTDAALIVQKKLVGTPLESWKSATIEREYRNGKKKIIFYLAE